MSRFREYLNELASGYGNGITFIDIDMTLAITFAQIKVLDQHGNIVRSLDNMQFNSDKLQPGEHYNFDEFRSAELFKKTSIPIPQTVNRIKRMLTMLDKNGRDSKIVFLTARSDFDDRDTFLSTFREWGINMDMPRVYVERSGNMKTGTVPERKKQIVLKYLATGEYRRCRMIDDHLPNLKEFLSIEKDIPREIIEKTKRRWGIGEDDALPVISFYALLVKPDGSLERVQ